MSDDFVDLRTFHDMHELEEVLALLKDEGIVAFAPGKGVAGLLPGAGDAAFQVPLRVQADRAEEARELIDAFLSAEPEFIYFPEGVQFPDGEDEPPPARRPGGLATFPFARLLHVSLAIGALWFLLPRYAPGAVVGGSGRTICAVLDECAVAPESQCREVIAQGVSLLDFGPGTLGACGDCLEVARCDAWRDQRCHMNAPHCREGRRRVLEECRTVCERVVPITTWSRDGG